MRVNVHGVIAVALIASMLAVYIQEGLVSMIRNGYVLAACIFYVLFIIIASVNEHDDEITNSQVAWGSHLCFLLQITGLYVGTGFSLLVVFVSAIVLGYAVPFLLIKRN